ncbi:hypothetical protein HPB48_013645 [Haemaphysalis longicornis]|uniref:Ran gtpase-activating protein n=1 Tax=Haemaphysalis longicornis TaxID=44386 RepID=A0A9J6FXV2_HAELO|nr:hypothetical protein HPB48_013645 [Haemaphysalis longicornis]
MPPAPCRLHLGSPAKDPETGFGANRITFPLSCTDRRSDGGAGQTCQIFAELSFWNELLWFAKLELREVKPGRLNVMPLPTANVPPNKHQEVQRAVVLLHWLLAEHWCVDTVDADCHLLRFYPQLIFEALPLSPSLTAIKLSDHELEVGVAVDLFVALRKCPGLQVLECDDFELTGDATTLQKYVAELIENTTTLKTLRLTGIPKLLDGEAVVEALRGNSTISHLTVDAPSKGDNRTAFYESLAKSAALTELAVVGNSQETFSDVEALFEGLAENRTLRKLGLQQYRFNLVDATCFSNAVAANTALQEVAFSCCYWEAPAVSYPKAGVRQMLLEGAIVRWRRWWRVEPFVHAIANSASLRRLAFETNHFADEEMLRLLRAVKERASFRELFFEQVSRQSAGEFCDLLRETDTVDKVKVQSCWSDPACFVESFQRCKDFPSICQHDFHDLNSVHLRTICAALSSHDSVTVLYLNGDPTEDVVDAQSATCLGNYLASTVALKEIHMSLNTSEEAVSVIVWGLSKNRTLEKLGIKNWRADAADIRAICEWIERSTTLHQLVWRCERSSTAAVLLSELSQRLEHNYTLTAIRVREFVENEKYWQVVKNFLRRNSSLVERAAHFVLGSELKRSATGFRSCVLPPASSDKNAGTWICGRRGSAAKVRRERGASEEGFLAVVRRRQERARLPQEIRRCSPTRRPQFRRFGVRAQMAACFRRRRQSTERQRVDEERIPRGISVECSLH